MPVAMTTTAVSSGKPPILLHGHLDVVPAAADDWQVHPFSGEVQDGYVWGRGDLNDLARIGQSVLRQDCMGRHDHRRRHVVEDGIAAFPIGHDEIFALG